MRFESGLGRGCYSLPAMNGMFVPSRKTAPHVLISIRVATTALWCAWRNMGPCDEDILGRTFPSPSLNSKYDSSQSRKSWA